MTGTNQYPCRSTGKRENRIFESGTNTWKLIQQLQDPNNSLCEQILPSTERERYLSCSLPPSNLSLTASPSFSQKPSHNFRLSSSPTSFSGMPQWSSTSASFFSLCNCWLIPYTANISMQVIGEV